MYVQVRGSFSVQRPDVFSNSRKRAAAPAPPVLDAALAWPARAVRRFGLSSVLTPTQCAVARRRRCASAKGQSSSGSLTSQLPALSPIDLSLDPSRSTVHLTYALLIMSTRVSEAFGRSVATAWLVVNAGSARQWDRSRWRSQAAQARSAPRACGLTACPRSLCLERRLCDGRRSHRSDSCSV